jgi:hypothetical protein
MLIDDQLIWESYVCERSDYSDDENPITIITPDNHHEYTTLNGVRYELDGGDSVEKAVDINTVQNTEGNTFYQDHIARYKEYIQNGGIIHTFPVQDLSETIDNVDDMVTDLEDSSTGDIYTANYWLFQDHYNVDYKALDRLIENYQGLEFLDEEDPEEAQIIQDVRKFVDAVKEYYSDEGGTEEYHLIDHNHRFEALKELGVSTIMVDIVG